MAGYGRERRRNAELVHRLQQLHGEQVDTVELKKRYQQLQEAHMEQVGAWDKGRLGSKEAWREGYRQVLGVQFQRVWAWGKGVVAGVREGSVRVTRRRGGRGTCSGR